MAQLAVRYGLLLRTTLEALRDATRPMPAREVLRVVSEHVTLTSDEREEYDSGQPRWDVAVRFLTGDAATIGWMSKLGGWAITEAGLDALEAFPSPDELYAELTRRYREIDLRRRQAQENLGEFQQFLARTVGLVGPGSWTAQDDLAQLAGSRPEEVADFLASGKVRLSGAYRVLNADGSIPHEGMLNASYRGTDLAARLATEGIEVDEDGRASQEQRLTAEVLKELLSTETLEPDDGAASARRAWMVRGSNVDGYNLVPDWLRDGFVSLSASQLSGLDPGADYDELKGAIEVAYQHKSYAYRGQRLEELDRFLRRMRVGNLVLTTLRGEVYIGEILGPARFADAAPHANLRREVKWLNAAYPIAGSELEAPVPALLQSQAYVVDLTEAYDLVMDLISAVPAQTPPTPVPHPEPAKRSLAFHPVTEAIAERLLMAQAELSKITDLLWERKQIIMYGPPGTGKTYLATRLARHLTDEGSVKLVQFHPSYTYEDFFEGFRPEPGGSGTLTFKLRPGPFRSFAEVAKDNPTTPYILIIDEINRANLAKVFGELYFLLEYRDESINLQYSPDEEFTLPPNLFIIGTMNTADRSIARIDTAMRRRFAFVELDPRIPPVEGLLSRWLDQRGFSQEAAMLLDELNRRIADADAAIGPSYLMDQRIYARPDGLDRVWQYSIMPLLEDLFYGDQDLAERYGLSSLRPAAGAGPAVT